MNTNKTSTIVFSRKVDQPAVYISIQGKSLRNIQRYIYWGRETNSYMNHSTEIRGRIEIADQAVSLYNKCYAILRALEIYV